MERKRALKTTLMLSFILFFAIMMVRAIVGAYTLTPTSTAEDLKVLPLWKIPLVYIWDYAQHGWICLGFAFTVAGLVSEFIPQGFMMRYMSSGKPVSYLVATLIAPLLCVCSCTMVPIFAGLIYAGGGIGPALTFLLVAPANNILADIVTIQVLGWQIALADMVAAGISAVVIGYLVSKTPWGKKFERQFKNNQGQVASVELMKQPVDERLWNALKFGGYLAKRIIPAFLVGLVAVSYFQAFFPADLVKVYLTGASGVVLAALLGGPLYTPTLIEVALGKALVDLGMSPGATVAWLMGQPYDIPNSLSTSRIVGWKIVISYGVLAFAFAVSSGLIYSLLVGGI
ncbi:MAG: permease [Candidatus Bathyarchaeota archaeon]|nr:permease [Candidatus Bathyarchaeota archaeon]MDH5495663.1 permease [Candidatus Bathyarchaeota archaeon]